MAFPDYPTFLQGQDVKCLQPKQYGNLDPSLINNDIIKLKDQVTSPVKTTINVNGTSVDISSGAMFAVRDAVGSGGTGGISTGLISGIKSLADAGTAGIGAYNSYAPGLKSSIESSTSYIQSGINSTGNVISSGVSSVTSTINEYSAPLKKTLAFTSDIMKDFDEWIKTTFLGQLFGIKGSEIMCTIFCIIISFLPCSAKKKLYDILISIKSAEAALKQGVSLGVDLTTVYNGDIVGPNSIADATQKLFGNSKQTGYPLTPADKVLGIMGTPAQPGRNDIPSTPEYTKASLQAPKEVKEIVDTITKTIKTITKLRITIPVGINGDLWDLAQAVLYAIQGLVLQMATELLNKLINPIEAWIKGIVPDNCVSNMAAIFFNKIIKAIRDFKQWILDQLKEFFGASNGFSLKWKTFGLNINFLLELLQMLAGLSLALGHFSDLLIACGISPCNETPDTDVFSPETWKPTGNPAVDYPTKSVFSQVFGTPESQNNLSNTSSSPVNSKYADVLNQIQTKNVVDALRSGSDIPLTNIPSSRQPLDAIPTKAPDQIDAIAKSLSKIINIPMENIIVTPQELKFIQPGFQNAPKKIAKLIADGVIENNLGSNWTTFVSPDNKNVDVVYTFRRMCGD